MSTGTCIYKAERSASDVEFIGAKTVEWEGAPYYIELYKYARRRCYIDAEPCFVMRVSICRLGWSPPSSVCNYDVFVPIDSLIDYIAVIESALTQFNKDSLEADQQHKNEEEEALRVFNLWNGTWTDAVILSREGDKSDRPV